MGKKKWKKGKGNVMVLRRHDFGMVPITSKAKNLRKKRYKQHNRYSIKKSQATYEAKRLRKKGFNAQVVQARLHSGKRGSFVFKKKRRRKR